MKAAMITERHPAHILLNKQDVSFSRNMVSFSYLWWRRKSWGSHLLEECLGFCAGTVYNDASHGVL